MSCADFVTSPEGRRGIGVIQPQSGLDYPFVAPSEDVRYLLADFYLAYDDPGLYRESVPVAQHPLRVKWLYGVGCSSASRPAWAPVPTHAADILIVDANDQTVFDSTKLVPTGGDNTYQQFQKRDWGTNYDIYEWIGNDAVCRIVVYKTWPAGNDPPPVNWPLHLAPENAVLDERAVTKMPKRLRTLKVKSGPLTLGPLRRTAVVFGAGNNMRIMPAENTAGTRKETQITFDAIPGAGLGKFGDCTTDSTTPIYAINGARANEYGDLTLTAGDCIWIRRPTTLVAPNTVTPVYAAGTAVIAIGSNCPACCSCADYSETALYMNRVRNRYKKIGARTHETKLLHENNIERWLTQRDCRLQKPLRAILTPQACPLIDVVLMFCNQCQQCATAVTMTATLSVYPAATAEIVPGYTRLYAPGVNGKPFTVEGEWPVFSAKLPPIDVGNSAYVRFRLRFTPRTYPYAVDINVTGDNAGMPILAGCDELAAAAYGSDSAALRCSELGGTL
jgi:hypothetical protein